MSAEAARQHPAGPEPADRGAPRSQEGPCLAEERPPGDLAGLRAAQRDGGRAALWRADGALAARELDRLQRAIGNAAVQRLILSRDPVPSTPTTTSPPAATDRGAALPTFTSDLYMGFGERFDTEYTPVGPAPEEGVLQIVLNVHITYRPFTRAMMQQEPWRNHRFTQAQRRDFQWTEAEKTAFARDFASNVGSAWSGRHRMRLREPGFSEYVARVQVSTQVVDSPDAAHTRITAQKVPAGAPEFRSYVQGNTAVIESRHAAQVNTGAETGSEIVRQVGPFGFDDANIATGLEAQVAELESRLRPLQSPTQTDTLLGDDWVVDLEGRASSRGKRSYNERLGLRRAEALWERLARDLNRPAAHPRTTSKGEEHAADEPQFQRVDVRAWNVPRAFQEPAPQMSQSVAAHEAGHMFGLGDEYVEEEPEPDVLAKFLGDRPEHFGDVQALLGAEAANELLVQDSASIMSQGGQVKRGHYVYFLQELNSLTGKRWTVE